MSVRKRKGLSGFLLRAPEVVTEVDIRKSSNQILVNGGWFYAKSICYKGWNLKRRFSAAWLVFKGECDVFRYEEDRFPKK